MDKKRGRNFSEAEKEMLLQFVEKYLNIVENKLTNAVTNKQKLQAWEMIAQDYNAVQTTGIRNGQQLKTLYEHLKKIARKNKAEEKVEIYKTGGGTYAPKITVLDERVMQLMPNRFKPLDVNVDSNAYQPMQGVEDMFLLHSETSGIKNMPGTSCAIPSTSAQDLTVHSCLLESSSLQVTNEEEEESSVGETAQEQPAPASRPPLFKKRKRSRTSESRQKSSNDIINKKLEILEVILQAEKENLKGKIRDNEIKDIIKEKEELEYKIKKIEYERLLQNKKNL